jgi:hypothetical protein
MPAPLLFVDGIMPPAAAAFVGGCAFAVLFILSAITSIKVRAMF